MKIYAISPYKSLFFDSKGSQVIRTNDIIGEILVDKKNLNRNCSPKNIKMYE